MQAYVRLSVSVVAAALLSACGGSPCEKMVDALSDLAREGESCSKFGLEEPSNAEFEDTVDECEDGYEELGDDDQEDFAEAADEFSDCVDDIDVCDEDSQDEFQSDFMRCVAKADFPDSVL